jgi:LacI family asc operon transcriptional repressor
MDEIVEKCEQPIMVLNRRLRKNSSHCVWSDHKASSQDAVSQLIAKGHREIAFITGSLDSPTGVERLSGYKDALAQHGIPLREALIAQGWNPPAARRRCPNCLRAVNALRRWWRAMTIWPSAP